MFNILILIIKVVIVVITTCILCLIWNRKNIVLDYIFKSSPTNSIQILKPIYTLGIATFLLIILVGIIYVLFKRRDLKMQKRKKENKDYYMYHYYKKEIDKKTNIERYYFKSMGFSCQDFENNKDTLEVVLNSEIINIEYGKNTKTIIVTARTLKSLVSRIFTFSEEDDYLTNIINLLCVGQTGSGKTYFLKILLANLLIQNKNAKLYLCDFKNYDFSELKDSKRYFGYTDVVKGIKEVYEIFNQRLRSNQQVEYEPIILYIDEYSAFLSNTGKEADSIQKMMSEILFMGRSYKILPIIGLQRADSILFKNGSRDQFKTIVALGNLSKEQKNMLFPDFKDNMNRTNGIGEGYVYQDGQDFLQLIKVKQVSEFEEDIIINVLKNGLDK